MSQRRAHLIEAAADLSRRETFLGSPKEREKLARAVIKVGPRAGEADLTAVLDQLRKVPAPMLRVLLEYGVRMHVVRGGVAEHYADLTRAPVRDHPPSSSWRAVRTSWHDGERELVVATAAPVRGPRTLALPPGTMLLCEVGRAVDRLCGGARPLSDQHQPFMAAHQAERALLDPLRGRDDAVGREETFALMFALTIRGDPLPYELHPKLTVAWEQLWQDIIRDEEARTHPERLKRVTRFLRAHVLDKTTLSPEAQRCLARWAEREHGPWERTDLDRHILRVEEQGNVVAVKTPWGNVLYPLEGELDREGIRDRHRAFIEGYVRANTRLSGAVRSRLEALHAERYGPWWPADWKSHVIEVAQSGRKLVLKTKSGDTPL